MSLREQKGVKNSLIKHQLPANCSHVVVWKEKWYARNALSRSAVQLILYQHLASPTRETNRLLSRKMPQIQPFLTYRCSSIFPFLKNESTGKKKSGFFWQVPLFYSLLKRLVPSLGDSLGARCVCSSGGSPASPGALLSQGSFLK